MPSVTPSPDLTLAQQHDAAGRHDDAINSLALGTKAGNLPCMRQLGKRLLTGDRAPLLAVEGARFVFDAANQGDAEAAACIAALTALGAYCTQSWHEALRWLGFAAQHGWQPARDQLLVLLEDTAHLAGSDAATASTRHWPGLAAQVDPAVWQVSPAGSELSAAPQVRAFENFISASACRWLIEQARGRLIRARVYDAVSGKNLVSAARSNTVANFNLAEVEVLHVLIQARMAAACGIPMRNMEAPAVLHYDVGEQITDHFDFVDPGIPDYAGELARNGQRLVTFLIYLNDNYAGGETGFPKLGFSHKGRVGEGLYFVNALADMQPDLRMLHAGRPPTRGDKWIVSQFVRSRTSLTAAPATGR
jgi:prolyl 4-hydroxylase